MPTWYQFSWIDSTRFDFNMQVAPAAHNLVLGNGRGRTLVNKATLLLTMYALLAMVVPSRRRDATERIPVSEFGHEPGAGHRNSQLPIADRQWPIADLGGSSCAKALEDGHLFFDIAGESRCSQFGDGFGDGRKGRPQGLPVIPGNVACATSDLIRVNPTKKVTGGGWRVTGKAEMGCRAREAKAAIRPA
jgi:hypothetical protein